MLDGMPLLVMKKCNFLLIGAVLLTLVGLSAFVSTPFHVVRASSRGSYPTTQAFDDTINSNWTGYVMDTSTRQDLQPITAVTGTFTVPNVSLSDKLIAVWVGIGGVHGTHLLQTGVARGTDSKGHADSYAWYEMYAGDQTDRKQLPVKVFNVNPGDSMLAQITYDQDSNQWYVTINDQTTGNSFAQPFSFQPDQTTAEWILEKTATLDKTPNFGTIQFTSSQWGMSGTSAWIDLFDDNYASLLQTKYAATFQDIHLCPSLAQPNVGNYRLQRVLPEAVAGTSATQENNDFNIVYDDQRCY